MVPGHNLVSDIYLETPDGRDGWAYQLPAEGYDVYVINAEETFVKIHKVVGNRITISKDSGGAGGGRGRGRRGCAQTADNNAQQAGGRFQGRGRGRFSNRGTAPQVKQLTVVVPSNAKITSGMRERTFKFRAGAELAGGLKNRILRDIKEPLSARIVTAKSNRITEINVITADSDINQSNVDDTGKTVIAIRPKRPPMKRK